MQCSNKGDSVLNFKVSYISPQQEVQSIPSMVCDRVISSTVLRRKFILFFFFMFCLFSSLVFFSSFAFFMIQFCLFYGTVFSFIKMITSSAAALWVLLGWRFCEITAAFAFSIISWKLNLEILLVWELWLFCKRNAFSITTWKLKLDDSSFACLEAVTLLQQKYG